jgi:hypothetical protein
MTTSTAERYHWINVMVGVLDGAFHLTDDEQFRVTEIVAKLLERLRIPERSVPDTLPIPVVQEMHSGLYSIGVESPRSSHLQREIRPVTANDDVVSVDAWRHALEAMVLTAYPDLGGEERLLLSKVTTDLLGAIGVPNRAASHFPPAVMTAQRRLDEL